MEIDREVKQVIVLRHDLKMRYGKGAVQACHGSNYFFTSRLESLSFWERLRVAICGWKAAFSKAEVRWIMGGSKKVGVRVESLAELEDIIGEASALKLPVFPVTDAGLTEFGGEPTLTCCVIGPADSARIDLVTKALKLL